MGSDTLTLPSNGGAHSEEDPRITTKIDEPVTNAETRSDRWMERIDGVTEQVKAHCGQLDRTALNLKPHPDAWSIAQVLDHLIRINGTYYPMLDQCVLGEFRLPWYGRFPFLTRWFGRMILRSVSPDRQRKIKTFPVWEPAISGLPGDIVDRFAGQQAHLKSRIEDALPLLEAGTIIHSPASRKIVYSLSDAFEIMVTHEERHLAQVREILDGLRDHGMER